jgi:hypothetical protein
MPRPNGSALGRCSLRSPRGVSLVFPSRLVRGPLAPGHACDRRLAGGIARIDQRRGATGVADGRLKAYVTEAGHFP